MLPNEEKAVLVQPESKPKEDIFSRISVELEKYERFLSDIQKVLQIYESKYPDLVEEIRMLRVNRVKPSQKVRLEIDPNSVSPLQDLGTEQLLRKTWKSIAQKTHPDLGGDQRIFIYARILYKSGDLNALNALLEAINQGDLQSYLSFVLKKLQALYEVKRATLGYKLLCLHRAGKIEDAEKLMKSTLMNLKIQLSTSLQ